MPITLKNAGEARRLMQLTLDGTVEEVKTRRKPRNLEAQHQALLFAWRAQKVSTYPQLRWLFSTMSGLFIPPHLLAKAREAGLQRGLLDLYLPCRRVYPEATYTGLAMDLKTKTGRPTAEQLEWARHLVANGWRVYFPMGALDAWRCICCYLGIRGADHVAAELERREALISTMSG